jgi:hypothetical protein
MKNTQLLIIGASRKRPSVERKLGYEAARRIFVTSSGKDYAGETFLTFKHLNLKSSL